MSTRPRYLPRLARAHQYGLTLVEIMVAMAIALFLLAGLFTIVQNIRMSFGNQNLMAQLQDNERLAMTLLGDVIESAGYFPDPTINTSTGALPVNATFATAGQAIVGTSGAAVPGDRITVRFVTAPNDGIINCTGGSNTTGANVTYVNVFRVTAAGNFVCALNGGASVPLVSGVSNLQILYGVKTDFTVDNGAVDSYLKASEMTATNWTNVISVKVTLTFVNPLAGQPNQPATIPFQRIIGVMNRAGVKT
jgi:type IV pilus assembly protein PilW